MKINDSIEIINQAKQKFKPYRTLVGFSGGNDSLVLTHLMMENGLCDEVVHIIPGIGIQETHDFTAWTCEKYNWPTVTLHAEHDAGVKYLDLILDPNKRNGGFPGPSQHKKMFDRLKERCLWVLKKRYRKKFNGVGRFLIATGIRQNESLIRMGYNEPFSQTKVAHWCNPLFNWTKQDCRDYIKEHGLVENPVSKKLGMSGECLCGAYAQPGELELIEIFYPETAAEIREIEKQARAAGYPWGWEECRPRWFHKELEGQAPLLQFDETAKRGRRGGKTELVQILREIESLQRLYEKEEDESLAMSHLDKASILMTIYDSMGGNVKGLALAMPMCMNCEVKNHVNQEQDESSQLALPL